jgi:hypothetical protein
MIHFATPDFCTRLPPQANRKGSYHLTIDYTEPSDSLLTGDDARWARSLVKNMRPKKPS